MQFSKTEEYKLVLDKTEFMELKFALYLAMDEMRKQDDTDSKETLATMKQMYFKLTENS